VGKRVNEELLDALQYSSDNHLLNLATPRGGYELAQCLKLHWKVLAATDCFTVEVATGHGLVAYYILFVIELATQRMQIAGLPSHSTAVFMQKCDRQSTDPCDGFLLGNGISSMPGIPNTRWRSMDYSRAAGWDMSSCPRAVRISTPIMNGLSAPSLRMY
jgi:hypothetical protein